MEENKKWALVTGASKGLGFCYAQELLNLNYNVIAVARSSGYASKFKTGEGIEVITYNMDLSDPENAVKLFERIKDVDIEIFINNAGFGVSGSFLETNLETEMNLIDLNIKTLHILTKLMMQKMTKEDGLHRIINIASEAAYMPGPLYATYFASKSYVLSLSRAVNFEMRKEKRNTRIISISPGRIATSFHNRAAGEGEGTTEDVIPPQTVKYAHKSLHKALNTKHKDEVMARFRDKWNTRIKPKFVTKKHLMKKFYKSRIKRTKEENY